MAIPTGYTSSSTTPTRSTRSSGSAFTKACYQIENIPIEEARRIFEAAVEKPDNPAIEFLKQKLAEQTDYEPTPEEIAAVEDWVSKPKIWLDEGNLQRMYDYPAGSVWDFFLHVLGKRRIPTPFERVQNGYEVFIQGAQFSDPQIQTLRRIKDIFLAVLQENGRIDVQTIFGDPIYEQIIGSYDEVNRLFDGGLDAVVEAMQQNFHLPQLTQGAT